MADTEGTITAEVATSIVLGQTIYDRNGEKVGTVDDLDRHTGWIRFRTSHYTSR